LSRFSRGIFSRSLYVLTEHYGLRLDEIGQLTPLQKNWYLAAYSDRIREEQQAMKKASRHRV
jgi:hypothetical protein